MPEEGAIKKVFTEEYRKECINKLKELLKEHDKLKNLPSDESYLERFLYGAEFDVEEAFKRMKLFYDLLLEYPEWFTREGPLAKKSIIDKHIRIMTPEHDKEGRPIYIVKIGNTDVSTMDLIDVVAIDDIWIEALLARNPQVTEKGLCVILDIANYPWQMMKWITPENIKVSVKKIQALPFKDFRFHIVNKSFLIHAVLKITWPFLPQHIKDMKSRLKVIGGPKVRICSMNMMKFLLNDDDQLKIGKSGEAKIKFHFDDWNSLYEHIDRKVLPLEYSGTNNVRYTDIYSKLYERNEEIVTSFKLYRDI